MPSPVVVFERATGAPTGLRYRVVNHPYSLALTTDLSRFAMADAITKSIVVSDFLFPHEVCQIKRWTG